MGAPTKLSAEAVLVLTSLAGGQKHGYAIQQDIESLSGRRLGPGSLYGVIARLEAAGYIAATETSATRRPYRLTGSGTDALADTVEILKKVAANASLRLAAQ